VIEFAPKRPKDRLMAANKGSRGDEDAFSLV
jgi:hypothetical protein